MEENSKIYIVDASFILSILLPDESQNQYEDIIMEFKNGTCDFQSSHLLNYEVGNALRSSVKRNRITQTQAEQLFFLFHELSIEMVPCDYAAILKTALKDNLSFYDASYVYLSHLLHTPLLTLDKQLTGFSY